MAKAYGTLTGANAANGTITANAERTALLIQNLDGSIVIYANFGTAAVASQCFTIRAGENLLLSVNDFPEIIGQLNLIAASGTPAYVAIDNL